MRGSAELALESQSQGRAFLATACAAWPHPALSAGAALIGARDIEVAHPVAVAIVGAGWDVPLDALLAAQLHAVAANLVSAGVRLVPLGQTDGQRAIVRGEAQTTPFDKDFRARLKAYILSGPARDGSAEERALEAELTDLHVKAVRALAERSQPVPGAGIVNVGHHQPHTVAELLSTLERVSGLQAKVVDLPAPPSEVPMTCAEDGVLRQWIGDWPTTPLEQGLGEFVEWMRGWRASGGR